MLIINIAKYIITNVILQEDPSVFKKTGLLMNLKAFKREIIEISLTKHDRCFM